MMSQNYELDIEAAALDTVKLDAEIRPGSKVQVRHNADGTVTLTMSSAEDYANALNGYEDWQAHCRERLNGD